MPFPKRIGLLLAATLAASGLAFLIVTVDSGKMNAEAQAEPQLERQVENKIPKHVPITIKLKKEKEKAFKDIKNNKELGISTRPRRTDQTPRESRSFLYS